MKVLQKIILSFIIGYSLFGGIQITHGSLEFEIGQSQSNTDLNLQTGGNKTNNIDQTKLELLNKTGDIGVSSQTGSVGIKNTLVRIAKDLKNLFFYIASLYLLIIILITLFSEKTEEASNNLKKGVLWVTLGLVVTQSAYAFIMVLFDKGVSENLAEEFAERLFEPFIGLLQGAASFFFIIVAIFAFYRLVTSNGNEDDAKSGKLSILYAIIGFVIVKVTTIMVEAIYGKVDCSESSLTDILSASTNQRTQCLGDTEIGESVQVIVTIINWANGFIGIIVVVLTIYAGARILLSAGDEDTLKNAKNSILYIAIGLLLLVMNYMILTFFILPTAPIV